MQMNDAIAATWKIQPLTLITHFSLSSEIGAVTYQGFMKSCEC